MRMTNAERRNHLLDSAWSLIGEQGTDAVTLATVAKRSGVSKPIAYDHFRTRTGLLCALYERYYIDHIAYLSRVLADIDTADATAGTIARAYVECVQESGPVAMALSSALNGAADAEVMKQNCDDQYLALCSTMMARHATQDPDTTTLIAFIGAAATVSHHVSLGRIAKAEAVHYLAGLLRSSVS